MGPGNGHGTIIVIEDDRHISDLVNLYLRNAGFRKSCRPRTRRAASSWWRTSARRWSCWTSAFPVRWTASKVCRELRRTTEVPVIFVTARDDEVDRMLGLELGADDYLTKPFSPRELVARVARSCAVRTALAIRARGTGHRRRHDTPTRCGARSRRTARRSSSPRASSTCSRTSSRTPASCSPGANSSTRSGASDGLETSARSTFMSASFDENSMTPSPSRPSGASATGAAERRRTPRARTDPCAPA